MRKMGKGQMSMGAKCWELRGCYEDAEMNGRCPHNIPGEPCPADCKFSACSRPTHQTARDILTLLNPDLNYDAAVKEVCRTCEFFLSNGPSAETQKDTPRRQGNPNRFLL